jgi:hypothetical protein
VPPPEDADLYQTAVLWEAVEKPTRDGELVVEAPRGVDCRWVNRRTERPGPDGRPVAFDGTVSLAELIPDDSVMWLGELKDWSDTGRQRLMTVTFVGETPDVKGREVRYDYRLMRFRGSLPEVEE